jgi:hypothetical protein
MSTDVSVPKTPGIGLERSAIAIAVMLEHTNDGI